VSKTLNDEIQLLIGSVTVRDAETAMKQAERATMLTLLAAVYLPLQLVTGIFGMNIREINDGVPAWRACVVALGVAMGLTVGAFAGAWWWRKRREGLRATRERGRAKMVQGFDEVWLFLGAVEWKGSRMVKVSSLCCF